MKIVQIMVHDDGRVMVGSPPAPPGEMAEGASGKSYPSGIIGMPEGEMGGAEILPPEDMGGGVTPGAETPPGPEAGMEGMQEARNIDEALQMAKDILTGQTPEANAQAESEFEGGYNSAMGSRIDEEGTPY